ncbi:MAG: DUF1385 domain-containing protein [Limnochordaceae bacterium]|nr:DUF1385 domain-containing protein [Limnochordaceae bacterium]
MSATPRPSFYYGGQAVLEGVMMRGRTAYAVATRSSRQDIQVTRHPGTPWVRRARVLGWPLVRGVVAMLEALVIGYRALNDSAQRLLAEADLAAGAPGGASRQGGMRLMEAATLAMAVALAVGLFVLLPAAFVRLVQAWVGSTVALNVIEGAFKALLFVGYVWAIGWMPDMTRVFQYHGAEHKAINCFESGGRLEVACARRASRFHPRCGTNFLFLVVLVSVFAFSVVTAFVGRPPLVERVLWHLAILPVVAGVSYEIIRAAGSPSASAWVRLVARPGMWLQTLTTREPDDSQLEVAIAALEAVLEQDGTLERRPEMVVA